MEEPKLNCSSTLNQTTDPGSATAVVIWDTPPASDNSGTVVNVTCDPTSDSAFAMGSTAVECTAVDKSDNEALCIFYVNVTGETVYVNLNCETHVFSCHRCYHDYLIV